MKLLNPPTASDDFVDPYGHLLSTANSLGGESGPARVYLKSMQDSFAIAAVQWKWISSNNRYVIDQVVVGRNSLLPSLISFLGRFATRDPNRIFSFIPIHNRMTIALISQVILTDTES